MYQEALITLYWFLELNRSTNNVFFPIGLVIWSEDGLIDVKINLKANPLSFITKSHHAENQIIETLNNTNSKVDMLITVPPCPICLRKLVATGKLRNIYVLFDPWGKLQHKELINSDINFILVSESDKKIDIMWGYFKAKMKSSSHKKSLARMLKKQKSTTLRRVR